MSLHWRRLALPVLLLGLLLSSCESPYAPESTPPPTSDAGLWKWFFGNDDDHENDDTVQGTDGETYQLIKTEVPGELRYRTAVDLIGSLGGELEILGHSLTVPAGAVLENTRFSMTALDEGYVEVELEANIIRRILGFLGRLIEYVISVGEDGFNEAVILELSYAGAESVENPEALRIGRYVDENTVEVLEVTLDEDEQVVRALLDHFSRYCMLSN